MIMSTIEQDTMLGAAKYGPNATDSSAIPATLLRPPPYPNLPFVAAAHEDRNIWSFEHTLPAKKGAAGKANQIRKLTCRTQASNYEEMVVCDEITWQNVLVTINPDESPIALDLSSQFLINQRFLKNGEIKDDIANCVLADPGNYWRPLPQKIDVAFELMFGFRFDKARKTYQALTSEQVQASQLKSMTMLGQTNASEVQQSLARPGDTNTTNVYRFTPNDIIVTISLVCCKQNWHFTPNFPAVPGSDLFKKDTSPLAVARFFPLTYVTPYFRIHKISTQTDLARPAMAHSHQHTSPELQKQIVLSEEANTLTGSHYTMSREPVKGTDSKMLGSYSAALYADHNWPASTFGILSKGADAALGVAKELAPFWNLTFSHYHTAPSTERDYLVVLPRMIAGKEVELAQTHANPNGDWHWQLLGLLPQRLPDKAPQTPNCNRVRFFEDVAKYEGSTSNMYKLPGQGIFDNIHLAPKMADPYANATAISRGFGNVSMAPFCVHDCMHTHWRWLVDPTTVGLVARAATYVMSEESVGQWNYGWNSEGKPYSQAGATMVPPDQMVTIRVQQSGGSPSPNGYKYLADALDPKAGHTSIFFHHGSAYSAAVSSASNFVAALNQPDIEASLDPGVEERNTASGMGGFGSFTTKVPAYVTWARFYWHLRFGFEKGVVRERVQVLDWSALQEVPNLSAFKHKTQVKPAIPNPGMGDRAGLGLGDAIECAPPEQEH